MIFIFIGYHQNLIRKNSQDLHKFDIFVLELLSSQHTMSEDDTTQRTIEQVNEAVGQYYKALGKEQQYNQHDTGLFEHYCDENGIDEETLKDDLNGNPGDSMLVDFDNDFPIPPNEQPENDEKRQLYIFNVLKQCYKDPDKSWDHLTTGLPAFNKQLFQDVETKDIEKSKEIYKIQCPSIYHQNLKIDVGLLQSYVH